MSIVQLKATLKQLAEVKSFTELTRKTILRDVFSHLERLNNPKNCGIVVRALLESSIWDATSAYDTAYAVIGANTYISTEKAALHAQPILQVCRRSGVVAWQKAVLLAALLVAECRPKEPQSTSVVSGSKYGSQYITYTNNADKESVDKSNISAALLVSLSYTQPKLSNYQQSRLSDDMKHNLTFGLYSSGLVYAVDSTPMESRRGFRELGLLTKTVVDLLDQSSARERMQPFLPLLNISKAVRHDRLLWTDRALKMTFLSILAVQQSLLQAVLQNGIDTKSSQYRTTAITSLQILRNLQGIHPDNSIYEMWRFCLHSSLDILSSCHGIAQYLDPLLMRSPLALNPLSSTTNKELFSKKRDTEDLQWLLIVVEITANSIDSPDTLSRVFDHCMAQLRDQDSALNDTIELLHSVVLSIFTTHTDQFRARIFDYVRHVLEHDARISERQFKLIFVTLYRLSLREGFDYAEEDPNRIVECLTREIENSEDGQRKKKLIATYLDLLPIIPVPFLRSHLIRADILLRSQVDRQLDGRFIEVCSSEMGPERSLICVKYLLARHRAENLVDAKARL